MRTFYSENIFNQNIILSDDEAIHACKVDRIKVGESVRVINNTELEFFCSVSEILKNKVVLKINKQQKCSINPKTELEVFLCLLKGDKNDNIIPKLSELGVTKLTFVNSKNVDRKNKLNFDRLNKIAISSAKQCGRSKVLKIEQKILEINDLIKLQKNYNNFCVFYENEKQKNLNNTVLKNGKTAILIGSEGGFCESEISLLAKNGAVTLSLGNLIFRAETAAIVATTLTNFMLGGF